jgi:hypothetical protein
VFVEPVVFVALPELLEGVVKYEGPVIFLEA